MANVNKDFNKAEANKILKKYNSLSGFDPLIKTRETKAVYFRALLYKVLIDFNYMNDRQVTDFFLSKGKKMNRVSILQAVRKIDIYYRDFADFRDLYDVYFGDKIEQKKLIEKKQRNRLDKLNRRVSQTLPDYKKDALEVLIDSIPLNKRDEILEFVSMRVKSWSWKSNDNYEIIEADSGISEVTF
mgnify:FL=1